MSHRYPWPHPSQPGLVFGVLKDTTAVAAGCDGLWDSKPNRYVEPLGD